jgi:hypothetical protein
LTIVTTVLVKEVGTSGGEVRHTEIRANASTPEIAVPETGGEQEED